MDFFLHIANFLNPFKFIFFHQNTTMHFHPISKKIDSKNFYGMIQYIWTALSMPFKVKQFKLFYYENDLAFKWDLERKNNVLLYSYAKEALS